MKDRIIEAHLKDFKKQLLIEDLDEAAAFEQFVNYCVISKHYPDPFNLEDVALGGGGDLGLDGLGIVVNDHLVTSKSDVDYFKKDMRRLDVQFIFVQSKTSANFDASDIGTFISGVRRFFGGTVPKDANNAVRERYEIKEHIYDASIDMDRSPICQMYYATTGIWNSDQALVARIEQGVNDLKETNLFSAVNFAPLDGEAIKRIYRELHHKIVREIVFEKHTILPQIAGVQEAYIGIVPCLEYLRLICDEEDTLNKRLFYDNVRDFQGHNPVNREIETTVRNAEWNDRFALLNNGVTVVARDVNKVGATFRLKDYQIVNGCQTSHILYLNRKHISSNLFIPFKLIITADSEVTNQIIQGTNRQTEVKIEAFESLAPFQKKLEEFYLALGRDRQDSLHYERRSKQYDYSDIRKDRIITLTNQVKCFVAMFLNEPHSTHRYYGELLSSYRGKLFSDAHSALPYYVCGAALLTLDRLFADGLLPKVWRQDKFQILMVFRLQNEQNDLPLLNNKGIEKYCDDLLHVMSNEESSEQAFRKAGELVERVRQSGLIWGGPPERTKAFTTVLIEKAARNQKTQAATTKRLMGVIAWFSEIRGYGFVNSTDGLELFVHFTDLLNADNERLYQGQQVEFTAVQTERGYRAVDVVAAQNTNI